MALDFPTSPTLNQVYTSGNKSWVWNGNGWAANNTIGTTLTLTDTQTLTNKTLVSVQELWTISTASATGTINYDINTQSILYYTSNASANFTLNFRASSSATLSSILPVGQSVAVSFVNTNGSTPYYPTAFTIDGTPITPKWLGGIAPTAGNASSLDLYTFEIIKTAVTPTYQILASQAKYA